MNMEKIMEKFNLTIPLMERLGLWHNGKIEYEMKMKRIISSDYMDEVPIERKKLLKTGDNIGEFIHRYPYWYYSSFWGKDIIREPSTFGSGGFGGNFIPQIPIMAIKRFTNVGDLIVDRFAGSGTTLDACNILNRKCIGIDIYQRRQEYLSEMPNNIKPKLIIMHPPYADFGIVYGDEPYLLKEKAVYSNGKGLSIPPEEFLPAFKKILDEDITPSLDEGGHVILVIGDGWRNGELYPLSYKTAELFSDDYLIKHIITKYIGQWTGRANRTIWEYRALKSGWGVIEHEYIYIFKRREKPE